MLENGRTGVILRNLPSPGRDPTIPGQPWGPRAGSLTLAEVR